MQSVKLDEIDWNILSQLQDDGRITNVELARRVGISPPPCLRRVRALEQAGVIHGYRALLNAPKLGFEVSGFALVGLHSQAEPDLIDFVERTDNWPIVRECYMQSGEFDFILRCVARDLTEFQEFIIGELTSTPNVDNVRTSLTIRITKDVPVVPINR